MITPDIENINITSMAPMPSPQDLHDKLPLSETAFDTVMKGRADLRNALAATCEEENLDFHLEPGT